jgi:hypothetical protein
LSLLLMGFSLMGPSAQAATFDYRGICDASAAVALDADHFVVADDESNKLFVYRRGDSKAETDIDLTKSLKLDDPKDEVDLEGAARIGDRIYWIASHSKDKMERRRFFATEIVGGSTPTLKEPNTFSKDLVKDMIAAFDLKSTRKRKNPEMKDALNIEGLAATPDGDLLIGFRNSGGEGADRSVRESERGARGQEGQVRRAGRARLGRSGHPQHRARRVGVSDRRRTL